MLTQPSQYELRKLDDYKRCLDKQVNAKKEAIKTSATARGKRDVAQLGVQAKQSISPLKVLPTNQGLTAEEAFALDAGISLSQLRGKEISVEDQFAWKWEYRRPLVRPDHIHLLPTQMRRLHEWYMEASKEGSNWLMVGIRDEHFFSGNDEINIEFDELF